MALKFTYSCMSPESVTAYQFSAQYSQHCSHYVLRPIHLLSGALEVLQPATDFSEDLLSRKNLVSAICSVDPKGESRITTGTIPRCETYTAVLQRAKNVAVSNGSDIVLPCHFVHAVLYPASEVIISFLTAIPIEHVKLQEFIEQQTSVG